MRAIRNSALQLLATIRKVPLRQGAPRSARIRAPGDIAAGNPVGGFLDAGVGAHAAGGVALGDYAARGVEHVKTAGADVVCEEEVGVLDVERPEIDERDARVGRG